MIETSLLKTRQYHIKALVFFIALVSAACGKAQDAGEFGSYVGKFEQDGQKVLGIPFKVENIKIEFSKLPDSKLAECTLHTTSTPLIQVNQDTWDALDSPTKEIVLYHELGHCILNRGHDNTKLDDKGRTWKSIMAQWPQQVTDYTKYRDDYMTELFDDAGK